jgi:carbonic anhydrase/acetyltransferase-like protein (isoleucine patch superfamily)
VAGHSGAAPDSVGYYINAGRMLLWVCVRREFMAVYELEGIAPRLPPQGEYWIAQNATVLGRVEIQRGASVWFSAVLRGDNEWITVGEGSNVQDGCVLHTDIGLSLTIGRNCTIGHQAILHSCTIGDNSLVGMGATVLNRARIGRNCLIGAKALIPEGREIPDNSLVIGMPGKVTRALNPEEVDAVTKSALGYAANWKRYVKAFRELQ